MEIRGTNPNAGNVNPLGNEGAAGPEKAKSAGFSESMEGAGQAAPAGAAGGAAPAGGAGSAAPAPTDATLLKLQARIQDGVKAGQPKQEILQSLISEQLKSEFGEQATPQMTAAVAERFQSDPQLSQIFNRLYSMATK